MTELQPSSLTTARLVATVHAAFAGLKEVSAGDTMGQTEQLDSRSRDVLRLLAAGAVTREIARAMGYSERTIKGVIRDVEMALGARTRAQAVAVAITRGLL